MEGGITRRHPLGCAATGWDIRGRRGAAGEGDVVGVQVPRRPAELRGERHRFKVLQLPYDDVRFQFQDDGLFRKGGGGKGRVVYHRPWQCGLSSRKSRGGKR